MLENMFARSLYLKTRPTGEEIYVPSFQIFPTPDSLNQRIPREAVMSTPWANLISQHAHYLTALRSLCVSKYFVSFLQLACLLCGAV